MRSVLVLGAPAARSQLRQAGPRAPNRIIRAAAPARAAAFRRSRLEVRAGPDASGTSKTTGEASTWSVDGAAAWSESKGDASTQPATIESLMERQNAAAAQRASASARVASMEAEVRFRQNETNCKGFPLSRAHLRESTNRCPGRLDCSDTASRLALARVRTAIKCTYSLCRLWPWRRRRPRCA